MLSLYNPNHKVKNEFLMIPTNSPSGLPVSTNGNSGTVARPSTDATFSYAECMLPNQLLIYKVYGIVLGCTISWAMIQRYRWIMRDPRGHWKGRALSGQWDIMLQRTNTATSSQDQLKPMEDQSSEESVGDSPSSSILSSLDNAYRDERKHKCSCLPSIYWKMVGWDVLNIALFAVPIYLLLFVISMF